MQEKTRVDILHSANLYGSEHYTLTVEIINLSDKPLSDVRVRALLIPGKSLSFREDPLYSETNRYEYEKKAILEELNLQVMEAYYYLKLKQKLEDGSNQNSDIVLSDLSDHPKTSEAKIRTPLFSSKFRRLSSYPSDRKDTFFSKVKKFLMTEIEIGSISIPFFELDFSDSREIIRLRETIPIWAEEATKISNWEDIERAENLLIDKLPEGSFLKRTFFANKEKLKLLNEHTESNSFSNPGKTFELKPGQTISFTFYCKAPYLLHEKKYDAQFEAYYVEPGSDSQNDIVGVRNVRKALTFQASGVAIPLGTILGGISGFLVRQIFLSSDFMASVADDHLDGFFVPLLGTVLLSCILAIVVRRSEDSKKFITIEDFSGGFFIGSIAGLFSKEIIDYLRILIPSNNADPP